VSELSESKTIRRRLSATWRTGWPLLVNFRMRGSVKFGGRLFESDFELNNVQELEGIRSTAARALNDEGRV
jgi:hypothetical protein